MKCWVERQVLWSNAHNVWVGDRMVELTMLQLVQPNVRFAMIGSTNQEVEGPAPKVSPHNVEYKKGER